MAASLHGSGVSSLSVGDGGSDTRERAPLLVATAASSESREKSCAEEQRRGL